MKAITLIKSFLCLVVVMIVSSFVGEPETGAALATMGLAFPIGRRGGKSRSQIEAEAHRQLSNLNGDVQAYSRGNSLLDSDGPVNMQLFKDATRNGQTRSFTITLTNSALVTRTALLCPGVISDAAGLIATGAFNDVNGDPGITGSGSPKSIEILNAFIRNNPGTLFGFKITATDENQLEQDVTIQREWPFGNLADQTIKIGNYKDDKSFNTKVAVVPFPFQMDNQTKISIPILGGATANTVTITLFFGTFFNTAKALSSEADRGNV